MLAHQFVTHGITVVVGDVREGYNPMHDVCRMMTDAAVALAGRVLHRPISSYQFATVGDPVARPAGATVPEYEAWGEARVSAGHYGQVIRYLEHVRPLEDRLRRLVNEAEP